MLVMSGGVATLQEQHELAEVGLKLKAEFSLPKKYKVILYNDDYTPMDFVVDLLKRFFYLSDESATQVMLQVHNHGCGVCGIFTRDIAETKVVLVNDYARVNQHPLLCDMEQVTD